jgi:hypothetical protein
MHMPPPSEQQGPTAASGSGAAKSAAPERVIRIFKRYFPIPQSWTVVPIAKEAVFMTPPKGDPHEGFGVYIVKKQECQPASLEAWLKSQWGDPLPAEVGVDAKEGTPQGVSVYRWPEPGRNGIVELHWCVVEATSAIEVIVPIDEPDMLAWVEEKVVPGIYSRTYWPKR